MSVRNSSHLAGRLGRAVIGAAVAALVIAGTAACNKAPKDSDAGGKNCGFSIAFVGALTGSAAALGINIEQGAELAAEQFNAKNGKDCVTIKKFDSQGSAEVAPGLARQIVADAKVLGVVGPAFSGESEAANPIFNDAGLPVITPSATRTSLGQKSWKVFHRAVANDDAQGPAAAGYIRDILKAEKVYLADDQSAYGTGLTDIIKTKLGSAVVGTDKTGGDGKQTDFTSTVRKVVASGATAFFYGGYYQNAGLIRKQLTAAGWTGTLVGADAVKDPGFATAAGNAAAAGSIAVCPCAPPDVASGTFVADYKARWKVDPGTYSDVAYDATNMFLQGISAGHTTIQKMNDYLGTINYKGVANTYKFTSTGELDVAQLKVFAFKFDSAGIPQPDQVAPVI